MSIARAVLLSILVPAASGTAAETRPTSWRQALRAGGFAIPVEWAGVWAFEDTTRECGDPQVLNIDTGIDTLCAGYSLEPDTTGGFTYNCMGTVDATEIDLVCTSSIGIDECTITYRETIRATRNGDQVRSFFRIEEIFTPPLCLFLPDTCQEEYESLVRLGPAPPTCATLVNPSSWSRIKTLFR
jgi:hypothetical protein